MAKPTGSSRVQRRASTKSPIKKHCIGRTRSMKRLALREYGKK